MAEQLGPEPMEQEKRQALQEAQTHIEHNITPALPGRKCVDDGYPEDTGQIARAGGDMGYVEILLALNAQKNLGLTPRQAFDAVYDGVTANGGKFYFHTDTHADPEDPHHKESNDPGIGCGHLEKASQPELADAYGLQAGQVKEVIGYAREKVGQKDENTVLVTLDREHHVKGTIIVDSEHFTVNARDSKRDNQYFIYDAKRDEAYMKGLVQWLQARRGIAITEEDFMKMSEVQTKATLHLLAQGKPEMSVTIDDNGVATQPQFVQFTP